MPLTNKERGNPARLRLEEEEGRRRCEGEGDLLLVDLRNFTSRPYLTRCGGQTTHFVCWRSETNPDLKLSGQLAARQLQPEWQRRQTYRFVCLQLTCGQ